MLAEFITISKTFSNNFQLIKNPKTFFLSMKYSKISCSFQKNAKRSLAEKTVWFVGVDKRHAHPGKRKPRKIHRSQMLFNHSAANPDLCIKTTLLYPNSNCYTKLRRNVAHVHRINGSLYFHTNFCNTIVEVPARLNLKRLVTVLPRQNFRPQLQRYGFKARCAKNGSIPRDACDFLDSQTGLQHLQKGKRMLLLKEVLEALAGTTKSMGPKRSSVCTP